MLMPKRDLVVEEPRDVYKLKILDPYKEGLISKAIKTYYFIKRKVKDKIPVGLGGTEGPVTTAVVLRGQDFFVNILLYPEEMKKLLELVTETVYLKG